jgi:hypothetical protein
MFFAIKHDPLSLTEPASNLFYVNNLSSSNFELDRFNVFHMRESLGALPDMEAENNLILKRVAFPVEPELAKF